MTFGLKSHNLYRVEYHLSKDSTRKIDLRVSLPFELHGNLLAQKCLFELVYSQCTHIHLLNRSTNSIDLSKMPRTNCVTFKRAEKKIWGFMFSELVRKVCELICYFIGLP